MYYKKKDSSYLKGHGMVIGYDNKLVFVRHGGRYIRVNPRNLQLVNKEAEDLCKSDDHQKCSNMIVEVDEDSDEDDIMLDLQKRKTKKIYKKSMKKIMSMNLPT